MPSSKILDEQTIKLASLFFSKLPIIFSTPISLAGFVVRDFKAISCGRPFLTAKRIFLIKSFFSDRSEAVIQKLILLSLSIFRLYGAVSHFFKLLKLIS